MRRAWAWGSHMASLNGPPAMFIKMEVLYAE